jgi:MFS family permease
MVTEAAINGGILAAVALIFSSKPPTPPSKSGGEVRADFKASMRTLLKNKSFVYLFISFSAGLGSFNTMATLIAELTTPFGFNAVKTKQSDASVFGASLILSGLVGCAVFAGVVGKYRTYKKCLVIAYIGGIASGTVFALSLLAKDVYVTACVCCVFGFLMLPLLPISFELGCELTFPVGEAMTGGLLNAGGQVWGIMQIIVTNALLEWPLVANLIVPGCLVVGLVFSVLVKQELRRAAEDERPPSLHGYVPPSIQDDASEAFLTAINQASSPHSSAVLHSKGLT